MVVFFNFAARVFLIRHKAAFNRLRPDDSVLPLICVLRRFDNEVVRDAFKDLADQFWHGDAIGDGTVGVDALSVGDVPVSEARETAVVQASISVEAYQRGRTSLGCYVCIIN